MSFAGAIQSVLRQYATFSGRATRPEFWWWYLFAILVNIATTGVDRVTDATIGISFVGAVASLGLLIPTLAVAVRRLHDSNLSGWWLLAPIGIGVVGVGLFIGGLVALVVPVFVDNAPQGSGLAIVLFVVGSLVLLASAIFNLVLMLRGSTPGPNRFGAHPGAPLYYPPAGTYGHPSPYAPAPQWPPPPAPTGYPEPPPPPESNPYGDHGPS